MKTRLFLDTNIFIYSFEFPDSNSAKIIELLTKGEIEAITSEKVLKEVRNYFQKSYPIALARKFRRYIIDSCIIIKKADVQEIIFALQGKIKDKDAEQLAVVRKYGIKFLISYDRDFEGCEEYFTPKRFLEFLKIKPSNTEF